MPARYETITNEIAAKINSGAYPAGSKLPSTRELTEIYGVSETVIRYVMVALKERRLVEGQPGRGVFVLPIASP